MRQHDTTRTPKRALARLAMLAGLALTGLSLGGCIVYAPPHHYYRGYY